MKQNNERGRRKEKWYSNHVDKAEWKRPVNKKWHSS
jgi:hypothetical protein